MASTTNVSITSIYSTNNDSSQFKNDSSSLSTIAFYLFLIHLIPYATPLAFYFSKISYHQAKVILANDDSDFSSSQGLQLPLNDVGTNRHDRAGRATFGALGDMADFTTSFSFVIDSFGSSNYGDGLTFFLAKNTSDIVPVGTLGLLIDPVHGIPTTRFVAVEFDIHGENNWDPWGRETSYKFICNHVGIDINSPHFVTYEKWWSRIPSGLENEASLVIMPHQKI